MIEHIAREQRLFAGASPKNGDLRGAPAYPCAKPRGVVKGQTLSSQSGTVAGENVPHSSAGHSRIAGRIISQWPITFSHDRSTALSQKCYGETIAEFRRRFSTRFFFAREKPSHLA